MGVANNNKAGLQRAEHFYCIPIELTAGADATITTTPAVSVGSIPFQWEELGAMWDDTNGIWEIRITDNGLDRAFSPERFEVATLCGSTEREPYKLRKPWIFDAGSAIHVEAHNDGGAQDTLFLLFIGLRLNP